MAKYRDRQAATAFIRDQGIPIFAVGVGTIKYAAAQRETLGLNPIAARFLKRSVRGVEFPSDGSVLYRSSDGSAPHLRPLGR